MWGDGAVLIVCVVQPSPRSPPSPPPPFPPQPDGSVVKTITVLGTGYETPEKGDEVSGEREREKGERA